MNTFELITVTRQDHDGGAVATITLNRPAKLNAMSSAMNRELQAAAYDLARDDSLRAVVLTATGKAFVGGADIREMAQLDRHTARTFITNLHLAIDEIRRIPVPVIGRINGFCLGAGLELAAVCDFRVAVDTAQFGMPEVRVGMPSVIEAVLLPRLMGWGKATEILLTGDMIGAAEAMACGLVQKVASPDRLDAQVQAWVQSILHSAPDAVRMQKRLIRSWQDMPIDAAINAAIDAFEESHAGDEPRSYLARFLGG